MTLVLLHGFLGTGADWAPVAQALPAGRRVLTPDLPGHGGQAHAPGWAWGVPGMARWLERRLAAEGIGRCVVAGYSMGGRVALAHALRYPRRVAGLVLVSASPGLAGSAARRARRQLDAVRARQLAADPAAFLRAWYAQPLFGGLPDRLPDAGAFLMRRTPQDPAPLARAIRAASPGLAPDQWERLRALRVSTLAVHGGRDTTYGAIARRMAAASPCVHAACIDGAGHAVVEEAPGALAELLIPFITNLDPTWQR